MINTDYELSKYLETQLNFNRTEVKKLIKKYTTDFLENGCKKIEEDIYVVDKLKLGEFIKKERKVISVKKKRDIFIIDNSTSTPLQATMLNSIYWSINLQKKYKLTNTELYVLAEIIILTSHGLNNKLKINQSELSRSLSISESNIRKALTKLITKKLIYKYKPEAGQTKINIFSLNLQAITGLKSRLQK